MQELFCTELCLGKQCKIGAGWPINTKASDGYAVGTSGGRLNGTKAFDGCSVGRSGGKGRVKKIAFDEPFELPTEWNLSEETRNLDEDLL